MKCCGKEHNSNYCPDCGKKLKKGEVIYDILEHFRFELNKHRRRKERIENNIVEPWKNEPARIKVWIAKWESWEKEILNAIKLKEKSNKK